ncbi:MAG: hypothetical protein WD823_01055 [Sulfuricaulis sp.]|uniref:hypothetical protein n=1 Tax=Sulfuricaulis sp. TaxID=2003553 RepID=UPI0034A1AB19
MSSINKLSSLGYALGILLGVALSGVVYATGPITDTFSPGGTLTADNMNNIKNAVNDLQGNVPSTSCRTNAGAVDAGAIRVGPLCVDNARQAANSTWNNAVNTCRTAGKRLMTPGEYIAAKNAGTVANMATNGEFEWVDSVSSSASSTDNDLADGYAGRMVVGYMGPATAAAIGGAALDGDIFFGNNAAYDAGFSFIFFRCAR